MKNILSQNELNNIENICKKYDIKGYHINNDGSVDVDGFVTFENKNLSELPLNFNKVTDWFDCCNNKLTTMKGAPKSLGSTLLCYNNKFTTLQHFPPLTVTQGTNMIFNGNNFPKIVVDKLIQTIVVEVETFNTFIKYQDHFDVWENGFNEDNFNLLMAEIKDGLE